MGSVSKSCCPKKHEVCSIGNLHGKRISGMQLRAHPGCYTSVVMFELGQPASSQPAGQPASQQPGSQPTNQPAVGGSHLMEWRPQFLGMTWRCCWRKEAMILQSPADFDVVKAPYCHPTSILKAFVRLLLIDTFFQCFDHIFLVSFTCWRRFPSMWCSSRYKEVMFC